MTKTTLGSRAVTALLVGLLGYQIVVIAVWLKLDMRPPRWDESTQLLLAEHSFAALRQLRILDALKVTDLTVTKPGFVPFLSALTFFVVGTGERLATFILTVASYILLAVALRSLALRLFDDVLVGAAAFSLVTCSGTIVLFSHFYTVDVPLTALVAVTLATAVEIRARAFRLGGWTIALGAALLVGICAKHLFAPFVAAPLLVVVVDGLAHGADTPRRRAVLILRQGLVIAPAIALGIGYHILNWAIIAEQLKRATSAGFFADLGVPPPHWTMWGQMDQDLVKGLLPLALAVLPGGLVLMLRARFALVFLGSWCLGIWLVLLKAAAWPLLYYYMPLYPGLWLLMIGWLGRGPAGKTLRPAGATALIVLSGAGVAASTQANLGTPNPVAVLASAPAVLAHSRPERNPFVAFDSTAPAKLDGNTDALPYALDWKMDDIVKTIADKVEGYDPNRKFNVGLLADDEYMSGDLLDFKLRQFDLHSRVERVFVLGKGIPNNIDFLITKTGDIYKEIIPELEESQERANHLLADDAKSLRAKGFTPLYKASLPDRTVTMLWANNASLATRYNLVSFFQSKNKFAPLTTLSHFNINGDGRTVLYTHPTAPSSPATTVRFDGLAIPAAAHLTFGVAINPAVWGEKGDGVDLSLDIETHGVVENLFKRTVDPEERADDRRWIDIDIPLDRFAGTTSAVIVTVLPRRTASYDQAGWSCLCIVTDTAKPQEAVNK